MNLDKPEPFEIPDGGNYLGTIIDVVDLPNQQTQYGVKNKVRLVWTLGASFPGQKVVDSKGKTLEVIASLNSFWSNNSKLYKMVAMILGQAPPLITSTEQLEQLLLGRSNQLFIVKSQDAQDANKWYANVAGVAPMAPGQVAPQAPQGFVRFKNRAKTQAGPQGQPVQTYAQPPQNQQQPQQWQPAPQQQPPAGYPPAGQPPTFAPAPAAAPQGQWQPAPPPQGNNKSF
jgi:hypothetical protein